MPQNFLRLLPFRSMERPAKYQDDLNTMVTASAVPNKRRVVRRRDSSSSLQHKIIRLLSIMLAISIPYLVLSRGTSSILVQRDRHLRGRKAWVRSDSQLFVSESDARQSCTWYYSLHDFFC